MKPTRTNPAYAAIAYKKAILDHMVTLLQTEFTTAYGDEEPNQFILSEDVFREDSQVPEEEIHEFIADLQQQSEGLRLQLKQFAFVQEHAQEQQKNAASSNGSGRKTSRKKKQPN